MKIPVRFQVNGQTKELELEPRRLLVEVLREDLGLTGTHVGCESALCGACTVQLDGRAVKSCTVLAVEIDGRSVTTVEGLDATPLREAFSRHHALQCGFCTPGMLMTAVELLEHREIASEADVRRGLGGVICRCTGYQNIVAAIMEVRGD